MSHRVGPIRYWARKKRPREGQSYARPTHCLTEHYHRSKLEARVCDELRLRKIAGDIRHYEPEVGFDLIVNGIKTGQRYYADFVVYHKDNTREIIDAKGLKFGVFKLKWVIMQAMFKDDPTVTFRIVTA